MEIDETLFNSITDVLKRAEQENNCTSALLGEGMDGVYEIDGEIAEQNTFLSSIIGDKDSKLAKILGTSLKIAQESGAVALENNSVFAIASLADDAATRIRSAYQGASGEVDIQEVAEDIIDHTSARLIVIVEAAVEQGLSQAVSMLVAFCPEAAPLVPILNNILDSIKPTIKELVKRGITAVAETAKQELPKAVEWVKGQKAKVLASSTASA